MTDISFDEVVDKLRKFELPSVDVVVGIAEGGIFPARLAAKKLRKELSLIKLNFRDPENKPRFDEPKILNGLEEINLDGKNILLVDDVAVSGKTLEKAKTLFKNCNVQTFVMKGKADFVLFTDIKTCVNWPWKSDSFESETALNNLNF